MAEFIDKCEHSSSSESESEDEQTEADSAFIDDSAVSEVTLSHRMSLLESPSKSPTKKKQKPEVEPIEVPNDAQIDRLLNRFKELVGHPFSCFERNIKSDLTQLNTWIVAGVDDTANYKGLDSLIQVLKTIGCFLRLKKYVEGIFLLLFEFRNHAKSKKGLNRLFATHGIANIVIGAPNIRSAASASILKMITEKDGDEIPWIENAILDPSAEKFDLAQMINWALTNKYTNTAEITYNYARLANEGDNNARQWLASASQVKYAKDCTTQVNLLLRGEMISLTLSEILSNNIKGGGDGKTFTRWLTYQNISLMEFLNAMRNLFNGTQKRRTVLFAGVANSGKSHILAHFNHLCEGSYLSFSPKASTFWLQPAIGKKLVAIDDASPDFWDYADKYMRSFFDGLPQIIEVKYSAPHQMPFPPCIITSNATIAEYPYLKSRIKEFTCSKSVIGKPTLHPSELDIADWIKTYAESLDLNIEDGRSLSDTDGEPSQGERTGEA